MASSASSETSALFDKYLDFVKVHEKIIIEVVAGLMIWLSTSAVLKRWDAYESRKVTAAQSVVASDAKSNDALTTQLAAMRTDFAAKLAKLKANADAQTREIQNGTPQTVAQTLGGSAVGSDISLPLPIARTDAAQLIQAPVLQAEADDEAKVDTQDQALISGLQKQLGDQTKACTAQVAELKVKSKRSFLRGFKWGFITGIVTGVVAVKKL